MRSADAFLRNVYHATDAATAARWGSLAAEPWTFNRHGDQLHHCWYCGSVSPLDLLAALEAGDVVELGGSDWKYGWPHKFYVTFRELAPVEWYYRVSDVPRGHRCDDDKCYQSHQREVTAAEFKVWKGSGGTGPKDGTGPRQCKFYSGHLEDLHAHDPEAFRRLSELILQRAGIRFAVNPEKGLSYAAPYHGYQR